jgi:hypothetical protein
MGLIVGWQLAPAQATFLTYSMVLLAFGTIGGFYFVWVKYPGILYPPEQFRDEANWRAAVGLTGFHFVRPHSASEHGPSARSGCERGTGNSDGVDGAVRRSAEWRISTERAEPVPVDAFHALTMVLAV